MTQRDRTRAVALAFDASWEAMEHATGWWPSEAQAECNRLLRVAGNLTTALATPAYVDAVARSTRRWRAFRGTAFDAHRFRSSLEAVAPLARRWESATIVTIEPEEFEALFELFDALRDLKPTERKWVASSKVLHHLLPDLIPPMDNLFTAPFLGRGSLPTAFEPGFLVGAMSAFTDLIRDPDVGIGSSRAKKAARRVPFPVPGFAAADCRIGLGRVVDFAVAGFALSQPPGAFRRL